MTVETLAADAANTIGYTRRQGFPSATCPPPDNGTDVVVNDPIVTSIQRTASSTTATNGVVFWDTSVIPSGAIVTQVRLLTTVLAKVDVQNRNWVGEWYPGSNAPISASDYLFSPGSGTQAFNVDITAVPASGAFNITLSNPTSIELASKTGIRMFISGGCPPASNFPQVQLVDTASVSRPQLEVTFDLPAGPPGGPTSKIVRTILGKVA